MRTIFAVTAAVAVLGLASCGGGPQLYPDTDVCKVPGFTLEKTGDLKMSGGILHEGSMEYKGSGDLVEIFHEYLTGMRQFGWTSGAQKIDADKASATLRKDNRTCTVDMITTQGAIKASIKVGATK